MTTLDLYEILKTYLAQSELEKQGKASSAFKDIEKRNILIDGKEIKTYSFFGDYLMLNSDWW